MSDYSKLNLFPHNQKAYEKVKNTFQKEEKVVGIVHATGTGKSYIALQLALDNSDKKIIYCIPNNSIMEHLKSIILEHGLENELKHITFKTYNGLTKLTQEEIEEMNVDLLILDEFHHLGAPVWGSYVEKIMESHPDVNVFGMTAYTVRRRGTSYERDMAREEGEELFSGKIVSRYDLVDAMIDGVLPKPIYFSSYVHLMPFVEFLEKKLSQAKLSTQDRKTYEKLIQDAKKRVLNKNEIKELLLKHIHSGEKYIFFCPPRSEARINDMESTIKVITNWLKEKYHEEEFEIYQTTSKLKKEGEINRSAFYYDQTLSGEKANDKIQMMFAINQYNEGVHAPNITGSILGRGTQSDIVCFEQYGRALAVRNLKENKKHLEKLSIEELKNIAIKKNLPYQEQMNREKLIELLCSPKIIDLAGNIEFIKQLENDLKERIEEIKKNPEETYRKIHISNPSFEIEIQNQNLFDILTYLKERLLPPTWENMYELAKKYYKTFGNLDVPIKFRTLDGKTKNEYGFHLGEWLGLQRIKYKNRTLSKEKYLDQRPPLSDEQVKALEKIDMIWDVKSYRWNQMYQLAKKYYETYGNLLIPTVFKTDDGITNNPDGQFQLGSWISQQRGVYLKIKNLQETNNHVLNEELIQKLESIGMIWDVKNYNWNQMYQLAKNYYETHGDLLIPISFITNDGITENQKGLFHLGNWILTQRSMYNSEKKEKKFLSQDRVKKLESIDMIWDVKKYNWNQMYQLAKKYYETYGNLLIPATFKTDDGITNNPDGQFPLGSWITQQRGVYQKIKNLEETSNYVLNEELIQKLDQIGMIWIVKDELWQARFLIAEQYYRRYGNLNVPQDYITENKYPLGTWISSQRKAYAKNKMDLYRTTMLESIGMIWNTLEYAWQEMYQLAKKFYETNGHLNIPTTLIIEQKKLGAWISDQRRNLKTIDFKTEKEQQIMLDRKQKLDQIGMIWDTRTNKNKNVERCKEYHINVKKNKWILNIPYQELCAKINYLKELNLDIQIDGKPNPLFSMSEKRMQEVYNISKEELREYYAQESIVEKRR